jgi:signal transduction histidine kinase
MTQYPILIFLVLFGSTTLYSNNPESENELQFIIDQKVKSNSTDSAYIVKLIDSLFNDQVSQMSAINWSYYLDIGITYSTSENEYLNLYNKIILAYMAHDQPDSLLKYSTKLLEQYPNSAKARAIAYLGIGSAKNFIGDIASAERNFELALQAAYETKEIDWIQSAEMNLASIYYGKGQVDSAIEVYRRLISWVNNHKRKKLDIKVTIYGNMGILYSTINIDSSLHYFKLSKELAKSTDRKSRLALASYNLGLAYLIQSKPERAIPELSSAIQLYKSLSDSTPLPELYSRLSIALANTGKLNEALEIMDSSDAIDGWLSSSKRIEALAIAETQFGLLEQELKNKLLEQEQGKTEALMQQQQLAIAGFVLALIMSVSLIFILYRKRKIARQFNHSLTLKNQRLDEVILEKDKLMGILMHDIRSPMAGIYSALSLMENEKQFNDETKTLISEVKKVSKYGLQMINNLWNVYSAENQTNAVKMQSHNLSETAKQIHEEFKLIAQKRNIDLLIDSSSKMVKTDPTYLQVIIRNLLSNALKFSPEGSTVWLEIGGEKSSVFFKVRDQGPGFKEEDIEKLHGKYQKLSAKALHDEKSSGLGLYLVKLLCENLDLYIELNRKYAQGAEFIIGTKHKA